ncbi:MAG TPA: hydroxysqualene dehydroxylase HpnE [Solirubrobacteraceae bacterium]|jgi:squalene-associated FAD-dependent desaturase
MSQGRVIVVGGGLAGIAASLECARSGAAVTLLESRGRLGGAAYSFVRDGITADNGQHVFLRCCTAYRQLLAEIEAEDCVTLQPRLDIPVLAPGGRGRLRRSGLPAPLHLAASLVRYPFLSLRERLGVARAMQALRRVDPDDPAADGRSFGEWLAEHGQGQAAIDSIWDLIARPTLNLVPADASLAQAAQVFQVGLLQGRTASDVGYARVPLGEIHDQAAGRALARTGVEVNLRQGATGVVPGPDGFRVELGGAPALTAPAVILAVPPDRLARIIPEAAGVPADALAALGSSPIVNLHIVFDRRVTELPFAAGVRTPVQWFFDRTASSGLSQGQYLAVSLSAAQDELSLTAEELRARYVDALGELLPQARGARVQTFFVTREHAATFRAAPGARALRPAARTGLSGLALAGAFTDTGWPATMEGAVRSGLAAAHEVLGHLSTSGGSARAQAAPELVGSGR